MSKIPQGKPRELPPEGAHPATIVQVIQLGTQPSGNPQFKDANRVQLAYEIFGESTESGDPFVVYKQYTFSNHEKSSLMKDLKAGLGIKTKDYEMDNALGKPVLITIEHKETEKGVFPNITNVGQLPKGMKVGKAREPLRSLYLDENFDKETFDALPEFLRTKIAGSPEYAEAVGPSMKKAGKASAQPAKKGATKQPEKKVAQPVKGKAKR